MYVTTDMLEALREAQEALMSGTCIVLLPGTARTSSGGVEATEGTVGTRPCRLTVIQPSEAMRGGAVIPTPKYVVTLPWDAGISSKHVLEVAGERYAVVGSNDGVTFKVATVIEVEPVKARAR